MRSAAFCVVCICIPLLSVAQIVDSSAKDSAIVIQNADSLAYCGLRDSLAGQSEPLSEAVLRAAEELAAEGLYSDAAAMIRDMSGSEPDTSSSDAKTTGVQTTDTLATGGTPEVKRENPIAWRISSSVDYSHLEDLASLDTTSRPERGDSIARLLETPLIISAKVACRWQPGSRIVRSVDPSLYVSNQKAALDFSAAFDPLSMLTVDAGVKAEKRVTNRAATGGAVLTGGSQNAVFVADREDSLDMVGGRATITFASGPMESAVRFEAPVTIEGVAYRNGRGGYYSFNDCRASPALSLASTDMRRNASVRLLGEYKDFRGGGSGEVTRADSFDIYRAGPELSGELWWKQFSASGTVGLLYEHYMHRGMPFDLRTLEAEGQAKAKLLPWLEAAATIRFDNRNESDKGRLNYFKDTIKIIDFMGIHDTIRDTIIRQFDASFGLRGNETGVAPLLRFLAGPSWTVELRCPVFVRSYSVADTVSGNRLAAPVFILESMNSFEPELALEYSGTSLSCRIAAGYAVENVPPRPYYTLSSNRGWKARADGMAQLVRRVSLYAQAEYQYRLYAPYDKTSRTSSNLQASSGISMKW